MDQGSALFSILIANYNNGEFLADAVNSVLNQTYKNWEIIIVDDCSADNSDKILQQYKDDERIKVFKNDRNYGCGYTKRRCVELASGNVCGFLDPDDVLAPDALELMYDNHLANPDVSLIYSNFYDCNENLSVCREAVNKAIPVGSSYLQFIQPAVGHFATFKREKYLQTTGIEASLKRAVDQDLYYKMEETGRLLHVNKALYHYRHHSGGISVNENVDKASSWHFYVIIEACKRRNIPFEDILAKMIAYRYIDPYKNSKSFKLGKAILSPLQKIRAFFSNGKQ